MFFWWSSTIKKSRQATCHCQFLDHLIFCCNLQWQILYAIFQFRTLLVGLPLVVNHMFLTGWVVSLSYFLKYVEKLELRFDMLVFYGHLLKNVLREISSLSLLLQTRDIFVVDEASVTDLTVKNLRALRIWDAMMDKHNKANLYLILDKPEFMGVVLRPSLISCSTSFSKLDLWQNCHWQVCFLNLILDIWSFSWRSWSVRS